jgi:hypothetical protein
MTDQGKGTITTEAVLGALVAIRGQKWSGADVMINRRFWRKKCSMGGCTRHTYIDKDRRQKPAHLLIECREFLWLSQALQDKMRAEQPVAGSVAYNAPPPPPNPLANMVQQGHQASTIQHVVEPRQPIVEEEAVPPP